VTYAEIAESIKADDAKVVLAYAFAYQTDSGVLPPFPIAFGSG